MLTPAQCQWASEHDWFVAYSGSTIIVVDRVVDADGVCHEACLTWDKSFRELRLWAGY